MAKVPALLKWIGNKQRFAEIITSYMPKNFNNYYEDNTIDFITVLPATIMTNLEKLNFTNV